MAKIFKHAGGEDEGPLANINIIPFVDVVLVLLIIFMLTSAAIARAGMVVNLPKASAGGAHVDSTVNLVCTKEGSFLLNGKPSSETEIAGHLKTQGALNPKLQAVIAADKGVEYGRVMGLIEVVKRNGVHAFALDVERDIQVIQ